MKKIIIGIVVAFGLWVLARPTITVDGNVANTIYTQGDAIARLSMYAVIVFVIVSIYKLAKDRKNLKENLK